MLHSQVLDYLRSQTLDPLILSYRFGKERASATTGKFTGKRE